MKNNIFLRSLKTKVLLPFLFNNVNPNFTNPNIQGHDIEFAIKNSLNYSLSKISECLHNEELFELVNNETEKNYLTDLSYESNWNVNLNQKLNNVFQFRVKLNKNNLFYNLTPSFDFYTTFFPKKRIVEGSVGVNFQFNNLTFLDSVNKVYLINLVKHFIEKQLLPLSFFNLLEIFEQKVSHSLSEQVKVDCSSKFNSTDFYKVGYLDLVKRWASLVEDKFVGCDQFTLNYLKKDLFYNITSVVLIMMMVLKRLQTTLEKAATWDFKNKKDSNIIPSTWEATLHNLALLLVKFKKEVEVHLKPEKPLSQIKEKDYLNIVTEQYEKNELFISTIFTIYQAEYAKWDDSIYKNQIFDKENIFHEVKDNDIVILNDLILYPEKYAIGKESKNFAYYPDLIDNINQLRDNINNITKLKDTVLDVNLNNFFTLRKDSLINNLNCEVSCDNRFFNGLLKHYLWGIIFVIAKHNNLKGINQFVNFIVNTKTPNKSISYRVALRDLRKIEFDSFQTVVGIDLLKSVMLKIDNQLSYSKSLDDLIKKVRTEDEVGKLIAERNSIATGFIVALFISLMWFIDTTFAVYQSLGSGNSPAPWVVSEAMMHGFVGFVTFILAVITSLLIYTLTKLLKQRKIEKMKGLTNFW